jgi:ubiquitin-conjugating enzyme E2 H
MKSKSFLSKKRRERDIARLKQKQYNLIRVKENEIHITLHGPKDTLYEKGIWQIRVLLPDEYPYKSPSIGFIHKIYHPNIDLDSGTICLDVINQTWTPMYDLVNIVEIFIPQLLTYPNSKDPLNIEAGNMYENCKKKYEDKVWKCVLKYAWNGKELQFQENIKNNTEKEHVKEGKKNSNEPKPKEGIPKSKDTMEDGSFDLSGESQLSELSDVSGLLYEEDIFKKD